MDGVSPIDVNARAQAFEAFVRPHLQQLYRLAHHFTGAPDRAEDLVQSLLLKLYTRADRLPVLDRPAPWLARALYHQFVDMHRSSSRQPVDLQTGDSELALELMPATSASEPEALVDSMLTRERIHEAMRKLPAEQRAVVAWHDIEGYTLEELSVSHDIPLGTLKSRLHRARNRLRLLLTEPCDANHRLDG
jgi:RNA polymerase sigma-70 factor (ECF subfamily)